MVKSSPFDPQGSSASSGGGQFSVEVAYLCSIITPLRESMAAGRQVSDHPGRLTAHLGNTGSEKFTEAAEHFISSWGYGMGRLVKDAALIADRLQQTADGYAGTDEQVADSMRGGTATGGSSASQGPVTAWVQAHVIEPTGIDDLSRDIDDTWKSVFG